MKAIAILAGLALVLVDMGTPLAAQDEARNAAANPPGRAADEKAIRAAAAAFVRAYNAGDTRALAELFTDDAEIINEDGRTIQGREAIAVQFASAFDANPGERIEIDDQSIRFLGPDVAFDSEGGHGVGLWVHDGDRWIVKYSGVLDDGRTGTATEIYTVVNPHMVRWKSVDQTVGEHVEPDNGEFVMVRRPPRPR